jgi:hypothetical protein
MLLGEPLTLETRRSIWSFTLTDPLLLLFAGVGSGWSPVTLAESVSVPPAVGVTTTVAVNVFDAPIVVQLQVMVPADWPHVPPPVTVAETNVEFAGTGIVNTGFVPCEVAGLKIEAKKVTLPVPSVMLLGEPLTLETRRSIWSFTLTDPLLVLFAGVGSGWSPVTLAESVNVPPAVGVTVTVAVKVFDAPIVVQLQVIVPADWLQLPPPVTVAET